MWKTCRKEVQSTNQRAIDKPLKRATFWMQEDTLAWLRAYASVSGISQGALVNAIFLDFQLRKLNREAADPAKVERLQRYVDALLGAAPEIQPSVAYRVTQARPLRQSYKMPK